MTIPELIRANGGATFDSQTLELVFPLTGFAVGGGLDDSAYLGAWINNDRIVWDRVDIVVDKLSAIDIARMRGQLAIFDFENKQEIAV